MSAHGNKRHGIDGWWANATAEQRLAQIDGGIECGLSARQVAACSGVDMEHSPAQTVIGFAFYHGRKFSEKAIVETAPKPVVRRANNRVGGLKRDKAAYLSGEPVNMWGAP